MKPPFSTSTFSLHLLALLALAAICPVPSAQADGNAVPLRWTAETSRVSPARLEAVRGETLALEATFTSYGQPLAMDAAPCEIYWQTNGMGAVYWAADATASGNVVRATFTPAMDPGSGSVRGFLGQAGKNYRAAFAIRFLDGPGEVPNVLPLPTQRIDFSSVEVANAPWIEEETDPTVPAATNALAQALRTEIAAAAPADYASVAAMASNAAPASALGAYVRNTDGVVTNSLSVGQPVETASGTTNVTAKVTPKGIELDAYWLQIGEGDTGVWVFSPFTLYWKDIPTSFTETDPTVSAWAKATSKPTYTASEVGAVPTSRTVNGKALSANVTLAASDVGAYTKEQADAAFYSAEDGALWASWWSGDGFRVAVSNYDVNVSSVSWDRLPTAAFEYRPGGTGELVRVWDERTRWDRHRAEYATYTNAVDAALAGKADLDWGKTSPLGADAPDGFTWLDTPAVAIAGGLSWQKTVTSEGAVWLLCSNGMVAEFGSDGASTNGYFRITDEKGNAVFEVVAGDKVTVGADPSNVYTWTADDGLTHIRVVYPVVSDAPPTLHVATSLQAGAATTWYDEGADDCPVSFAGWTGTSGAWTNALWRTGGAAAGETDALFAYATYQQGGETYVKNHAPVSMSKLVLNGVTYTLGTATIDGHTVLTLTPQGQ